MRKQHSANGASDQQTQSSRSRPAPSSSSNGTSRSLHRLRSRSAPPSTSSRHLLPEDHFLEEHYRVDTASHVVLPGVIKYDNDWARDSHDFFNLIALVPVCVLNGMNWNWDMLLASCTFSSSGGNDQKQGQLSVSDSIAASWTGEWFDMFFQITALYFIVDLIWVAVIPSCVKSPATIIQHHIATLFYIAIPYLHPFVRWLMGACMSVEVNTWFLIARRVFNKQGFPPWILNLPTGVSIRVKLISILFYSTWIGIRCVIYPVIWIKLFSMWKMYSVEVGTMLNVLAIALPLHTIFCGLNFKWTWDLIVSKIRYWRKGGKGGSSTVDKGL